MIKLSAGRCRLLSATLAATATFTLPLAAQTESAEKEAVTFALTLENDVFAGTDQGYTNGTRFSWDFAEAASYDDIEALPGWARFLTSPATSADQDGSQTFGATISLGQNIYTPENKETTELILDDRPYAGWTYLSLALRERDRRHEDTFEITLGVVGPDSFAEDVQNWVHEKIGSTEARGWDNQLKNEFGGIISWRRETELFSPLESSDNWGADMSGTYGLAVGTIQTFAHAGANLRIGYNRSLALNAPRIIAGAASSFPSAADDPRLGEPASRRGIFLTLGAEGRYVARNIFIEGNTWSDSHGLEAEPWVADYYASITAVSGDWSLAYVYTRRTKEFDQQDGPHEFGGLTLAHSF